MSSDVERTGRLWRDYFATRTVALRNELVEAYMPLVRTIVRKSVNGSHVIDDDDRVSDGVLGLIRAIETYDPARRVNFSTYASHRIRGAIRDGLRGMDWPKRRGRRRRRECRRQLNVIDWEGLSGSSDTELTEARILIEQILPALSGQQQQVVRLRFFQGLNLDDIGARLGISGERVRQVLATSLERLKRKARQ